MADSIERTLLEEIYAAPDDDGPRSIYADWLIERDDPRGTFIALQLARARRRDPVISDDEQQLLDAHWRGWIGEPATHVTAGHVLFERGFWSIFEAQYHVVPGAAIDHPAWGTVRRMDIGLKLEPQLPALLAATHRSLRTVLVPSRAALALVAQSGLAVEELVLMFDMSRDPPSLAPVTALPALRRLGFHCQAEFAVRWLERANDIGIRDVMLQFRPHVDYVRKVLRRAKRTQITRLAIEVPDQTVFHAERDTDGTLAIRTIELGAAPTQHVSAVQQLDAAKQWLVELAVHVDPGVKVAMPQITPALAEYADAKGMRLVRNATRLAVRPRSG